MEYGNLCTFISYLILHLQALEKMINLQIYVCGMLKHFLKLCSKKPQKSSPEFSRLCGRPPALYGGGRTTCPLPQGGYRECISKVCPVSQQKWAYHDWYGLFLPIWCQHWDCTLYDFATFHTKNGCNRLILSSYPSSDFIEIKSPLKNYFFFLNLICYYFSIVFLVIYV